MQAVSPSPDDDLDRLVLGAIGDAASDMVQLLEADHAQPGQKISHYRIVERIGEGGMGVVCKAIDEKLDRTVALKLLLPLHTNAGLQARLEREARAASALNHPAICTVHDFDEQDGHHFIVMEYLEGETLKARLARGPLSEREAIAIALPIASALDAAHARGLVHCDIKPANIFLTSRGETKVLDFGIARTLRDANPGGRQSSPGSSGSGTRAYMSPEQFAGDDVDQRTDIYSFGAVLREAVAGPSVLLARLITRMIERDRSQRPSSMAEVSAALAEIHSRQPRRPRLIAVAAVALLAIAGGAAWAWWPRPPALAERDWVLVADIENRTSAPVFDELLDDAVSVQMGQSPYLNVFAGARLQEQLSLMRQSPNARLTPEVARQICARAGIPAFITGSITSLGTHYVIRVDAVNARTGDYFTREQAEVESQEGVLKAIGQAASAIRRNLGESIQSIQRFDVPVESATTSSLEALRAFHQGQDLMTLGTSSATKAMPYYRRAIELDPEFALAYSRLAAAYESAREGKRAEEAASQAFKLRDRVSERERYQIMARYYGQVSGERSKAIEAIEMWIKAYPNDGVALNSLSAYLKDVGQLERAIDVEEKAVQLSPTLATYRSNLAGAYVRASNFNRANEVCEEAIRQKLENSTIHRFLHTIAFLKGDREGMAREEAWRAKGTSDYANTEYLASLAGASGRLKDARSLYSQAIQLAERQKLTDRAAQDRVRLAMLEAYIGDEHTAAALAHEVLAGEPDRLAAADAAFVLAAVGDSSANAAMAALVSQYPNDEAIGQMWRPLVDAVVDIRSGKAGAAEEKLRLLDSYDRGDHAVMRPSYYAGLARLAAKDAAGARASFTKVIENRGVIATLPIYALAELGLARAAAMDQKPADARAAYEKFFEVWKDADADLAVMRRAREELLSRESDGFSRR